VVLTTSGFTKLAQLAGKANGVQNLATAEYPGPIGIHDHERITRNIEEVLIDRIVEGLTREVPVAQGANRHRGNAATSIVFSGNADEVSRHFSEQGWSDGLPIVPPTVKRIEAFLRFTSRPAHETVATMLPENLRATPWNIAANGVMAGCSPETMPVLVAIAEAMGDERCGLNMIGTSSGLIPFCVLNGPLAERLRIAAGPHLISMGSNPALGRTLSLLIRNLAGFRPGLNYMGTFGYPLAFALAEYESESPWEPFHVEHGYELTASTVTIGVTNNWGPSPGAASTDDLSGADTALELMSREIKKKVRLYNYPGIGPEAEHVMITVLITPTVAKILADAGYSKQDVKRHLHENTAMSLRDFDWILRHQSIMRTTVRAQVEAGVYPPEFLGGPDDTVRILSGPDILHIVVCGDPNRNRVMVLEGAHTRPTIKQIEWREVESG
jgi:hypothetical protein